MKVEWYYRYLVLKSLMFLLGHVSGESARELQDAIQAFIDKYLREEEDSL